MLRYYILGVALFCRTLCIAQEVACDSLAKDTDPIEGFYVQLEGDSLLYSSIALEEVYIFGNLEFANLEEKLRYYVLRRKTLKVYPYAKLAAERLLALNDSLNRIEKKRHQKKYIREVQQYIEEEFAEQLKKLTRTEGQILVKLIHRQTGKTAFDLVKELRGGWRAFWYSTTASMFNITLKETFRPQEVQEDYLIEDMLQRAFAAHRLEPQASALDYDYTKLKNQWKHEAQQKD